MTQKNFKKFAWLTKGCVKMAKNKGNMLKPALRSGE